MCPDVTRLFLPQALDRNPTDITAIRGVADGGGGVAVVTTPALLKTAEVDPRRNLDISVTFLETLKFSCIFQHFQKSGRNPRRN